MFPLWKSTGVLCHVDVALVCLGGVKVRADHGKGTELERHMGLLSGVFLIMGTMIGKEAAKEDRYLSSNSFFSVLVGKRCLGIYTCINFVFCKKD